MPDVNDDVHARLRHYNWPGNIRQLKNLAERLVVQRRRTITVDDLPRDIGSVKLESASAVRVVPRRSMAEQLLDQMRGGECFWSAIYGPFMSRDLTRDDVRAVTTRGLELTQGDVGALLHMFNMQPDDEKRFLNFLRKHQCQIGQRQLQAGASPRECAADAPRASRARTLTRAARMSQPAVHAHE